MSAAPGTLTNNGIKGSYAQNRKTRLILPVLGRKIFQATTKFMKQGLHELFGLVYCYSVLL
ncbi:MAG: hypothetical protein CSA42_00135 [Gammaproteobacteria bacterium]|nr:MAG: hypothetical protein CSA42_00135 [Gammaproteobacteria bacterium]